MKVGTQDLYKLLRKIAELWIEIYLSTEGDSETDNEIKIKYCKLCKYARYFVKRPRATWYRINVGKEGTIFIAIGAVQNYEDFRYLKQLGPYTPAVFCEITSTRSTFSRKGRVLHGFKFDVDNPMYIEPSGMVYTPIETIPAVTRIDLYRDTISEKGFNFKETDPFIKNMMKLISGSINNQDFEDLKALLKR